MPKITVGVYVPGISTDWTFIDFLLDTGAASTSIHPMDAVGKLGIDPDALADKQRWTDRVGRFGVGGEATYFRVPTRYLFQSDTGQMLLHSTYGYLGHLDRSKPRNQTLESLESLIGWDLLQIFRIVADYSQRRIELHPTVHLNPYTP